MEEVWKDINLTSLHHERRFAPLPEPHHHHHHHHHRAMILQDFLSGPCFTVSRANAAVEDIPLPPPPPLLPPTALSLSSGRELQYLGGGGGGGGGSALMNGHSRSSSNSNGSRVHGQANNNDNNARSGPFMSPSFSDAVIGPSSPAGFFSFCSKKRVMPEGPGIGGDRRYKRMIKNRESAARSRARKQAYTNELELEVAHLLEENAKLKKQLEELRLAMDAQLPNRIALKRSSSAPF
uniref:Protein FD n=2 Tax=Elaeis guineensis var. tenera TaxID=51953 RepID=A0A6I9R5W4_ELAGV|nr:protein FD [Elaeis guineensis]